MVYENSSPGKILSASVPTFEASTRYGHMDVVVQNTGTIPSEYHVQVISFLLPTIDKLISMYYIINDIII